MGHTYVPPGKGLEWWEKLNPQQRIAATEPFFEEGKSNCFIATEFGVSPGSIANLRNRRNHRLHPERYATKGAGRVAAPTPRQEPKREPPTQSEQEGVTLLKQPSRVEARRAIEAARDALVGGKLDPFPSTLTKEERAFYNRIYEEAAHS